MNNKGNIGRVGVILVIFIGAIVGLVLLQSTAQQAGASTNTAVLVNRTFTAPAVGSTIDLVGQELLDTPVVTNATNMSQAIVPSSNYTITEGVSATDGLKRIRYTSLAGPWAGRSVNITYTYGPEGYIEDASSRSIFGFVILFGAIAILVFMINPTFREGIMDFIGR